MRENSFEKLKVGDKIYKVWMSPFWGLVEMVVFDITHRENDIQFILTGKYPYETTIIDIPSSEVDKKKYHLTRTHVYFTKQEDADFFYEKQVTIVRN